MATDRDRGDVLTVNPGSSSLKLAVVDSGDAVVAAATAALPAGTPVRDAIDAFVGHEPRAAAATAIGVRVVHGGAHFTRPVVVDAAVAGALGGLRDLAPLHNLAALDAINLLTSLVPHRSVVACFDTSFHATLPAAAATYALPWEWIERFGLRRFGFHGLSHAWASRRAEALAGVAGPKPARDLRIVTCHLGAGASLAAVVGGVCVDTTMGFTPVDGLVMARRSGSVDPGMLAWLIRHGGIGVAELEEALDTRSGLAGLSGVDSGDMRAVLDAADRGDRRARLALDVYVHRLAASIAAMASAMGGVDVVVFTGGVGEGAPVIRSRTAEKLAFLGVVLDVAANAGAGAASVADQDIGQADAPVRCFVVHAREDVEIAREVRTLLSAAT